MAVKLNHTIVWAKDNLLSATFLADVLGLAGPEPFGPFQAVEVANGVSLDYHDAHGQPITPQHYAFLITESEFDEIFGRIRARGIPFWADPMQSSAHEINHGDGGRGVYFEDPDGHLLEVITRPYGSNG